MHPILFEFPIFHLFGLEIGPIRLYSYGLMVAIGFMTALHLSLRDVAVCGWDRERVVNWAFLGLVLGVAGTRLAHIILYSKNYSWNDPVGWFAIWRGGLVFQGCLPVVLLIMYFGCKKEKIPFWGAMDVAMPQIALGEAFGRIGCYLNGCCYGDRCDSLAWAVRFPRSSYAFDKHLAQYPDFPSDALWSYPVHPTQLYSALLLFAIFVGLRWVRKRWYPFEGFLTPAYMVTAGLYRFGVEFLRDDGNPTNLGLGLISNQQLFALLMVAGGFVLYRVLSKAQPHWPVREEPVSE